MITDTRSPARNWQTGALSLLHPQHVTRTHTLCCAFTNITTDGEGDGNRPLYRNTAHKALARCTVKSTSAPFHPLVMKPDG